MLLLEEESTIPFKIGETFIELSSTDIEKHLAQMEQESKKELDDLKSSMENITQQMTLLKNMLYGKFKNAINLEMD
jgi:prefoldin subunit 4